jgi:hypothetical protein
MTRVTLTVGMHSSTASLLRCVFVGSGAEGVSMPTPSINALGFFLPFIAVMVLSHVEPMLHHSFIIVVQAEVLLRLSLTFGGEWHQPYGIECFVINKINFIASNAR